MKYSVTVRVMCEHADCRTRGPSASNEVTALSRACDTGWQLMRDAGADPNSRPLSICPTHAEQRARDRDKDLSMIV